MTRATLYVVLAAVVVGQLSTASIQPDLIIKLASIKDVAESKLATAANAVADAKTDTGKSADKYDYVVVGSGPGGATVAHQLTANPKLRVLVLEAGPDADAAPPITVSSNAWMLPVMYVPQYFWQMATMPFVTNFDATNALPQTPTRRRQLLHDHTAMEQYMGGRLLGGSSSINGEQVVWPTAKKLASWQAAAGGDPDWAPDACFNRLRALETLAGTSPTPRGASGPLAVSQEPVPADASTFGNDFMAATQLALGTDAPSFTDYNDPATPISVFPQWQLSQNATTRARSSSSTSMLSKDVQAASSNLVVRTQATAMRVLFEGNVAVGVLYSDGGNVRVASVTREVIVAAGHRSSLLLEQSGVGNRTLIEPMLAKDGRRVVADVPAVGENLGNDGVVLVPLNATAVAGVPLADPNDLYAGGAFLPYPNNVTRGSPSQTTGRFSQIIGAPLIQDESQNGGKQSFSIGAILLNTSSTGYAHIQSGDPFDEPLVLLPTFGNEWDQSNWYWLMKFQVVPIIQKLIANYGFTPDAMTTTLLGYVAQNKISRTLGWVRDNYTPSHHWFGTCRMGTSAAANAVVDSSGRVFGVTGLRVADASILTVKPDGNTQMPAYLVGATIAEKILREA